MNQLLVAKFQTINTIISEIKQSPEWEMCCNETTLGLTPADGNYAMFERILASIENDFSYLEGQIASYIVSTDSQT